MNNEQLQRLAELLGWEYCLRDDGQTVWLVSPGDWNAYKNPLQNAELMVRLMVEYGINVVNTIRGWDACVGFLADNYVGAFKTPQLAVLHAALAKLEAQADETQNSQ